MNCIHTYELCIGTLNQIKKDRELSLSFLLFNYLSKNFKASMANKCPSNISLCES